MPKKQTKPPKSTKTSDIRADIADMLKEAWPENVVMPFDSEESYYWDIHDDLVEAVSKITEAEVMYEREPESELHWDEGDDPDEDPPADSDPGSSYYLFFLGMKGEAFEFAGEMQEDVEDEEGEVEMTDVATKGHYGCAVAISLVAPVAALSFDSYEYAEDGSCSCPDIDSIAYRDDGTTVSMEEHYADVLDENAMRGLRAVRDKVAAILKEFGVEILAEADLRKRVPWLTLDEEIMPQEWRDTGSGMEPEDVVTVRQAFFFRDLC